jgi:hypothetical protein
MCQPVSAQLLQAGASWCKLAYIFPFATCRHWGANLMKITQKKNHKKQNSNVM